jgi:integrase
MTNPYALTVAAPLEPHPHVTEEEAKRIWHAVDKIHVRLLIKTLWYGGLRISEACALTVESFENHPGQYAILVMTLKKRQSTKRKTVQKPDRLPIPDILGDELDQYIRAFKLKPKDRLFPSNRSTYWRQIQAAAQNAGLPHWKEIHPHSFRHGFVYDKAKKGVHPYILTKLARHADLKTTLGYYEPGENDLREAMER